MDKIKPYIKQKVNYTLVVQFYAAKKWLYCYSSNRILPVSDWFSF